MAKKIKPDRLQSEIMALLSKYNENVTEATQESVRKTVKWGVNQVKAGARGYFKRHTGDYANGWTSLVETGRLSAQGTIYNKKVPGLPHLLEKGHANRGGGRTDGKEHIGPVNDEVQRILDETIRSQVGRV